jgi:hypothetical protein
MKVAITADLHICNNLFLAKLEQVGYSDRLIDGMNVLDEVLKADVDAVFILGDLHHNRLLDAPTLTMTSAIGAKDHGKPIYVLPGNHDAHDSHGIHYNVNHLGYGKGIELLEYSVSPSNNLKLGGTSFAAMPYLPDRKAKIDVRKLKGDILLCHQSIAGCHQGGWVSKIGLEPTDYDQFNYVIAGHFHQHQEFHDGMYVGSPWALNFQETGPKGYWVFEFDAGQVLGKEFVKIDSPKFITLDCDVGRKGPAAWDVMLGLLKGQKHERYVRCRIIDWPEGDVAKLRANLKDLAENLPVGVRALTWTISTQKAEKGQPQLKTKDGTLPPIEVMLKDYVGGASNVPDGGKAALFELGLDILSEVRL